MKIALIGYGKMGKAIEGIAIERGHEIVEKVDVDGNWDEVDTADAAIEFTMPKSAVGNIEKCFSLNVPIVVGTTGWYDEFERIKTKCLDEKQALFTATNFSIGVNVFFEINKKLAQLMNPHREYEVTMEETHHIHKLDSPSGTGITLANGILENLERKTAWTEAENTTPNQLKISAFREGEVPGTHKVKYESEIDTIEIIHEAKNRKGFALGAVLAAEWIADKKGVFGMKDLLNL